MCFENLDFEILENIFCIFFCVNFVCEINFWCKGSGTGVWSWEDIVLAAFTGQRNACVCFWQCFKAQHSFFWSYWTQVKIPKAPKPEAKPEEKKEEKTEAPDVSWCLLIMIQVWIIFRPQASARRHHLRQRSQRLLGVQYWWMQKSTHHNSVESNFGLPSWVLRYIRSQVFMVPYSHLQGMHAKTSCWKIFCLCIMQFWSILYLEG